MSAFAFLVLLTFAAPEGGVQWKTLQCPDMRCVAKIEDAAHLSTTLTRFQVWERGSEGRAAASGQAFFAPIIDWQVS